MINTEIEKNQLEIIWENGLSLFKCLLAKWVGDNVQGRPFVPSKPVSSSNAANLPPTFSQISDENVILKICHILIWKLAEVQPQNKKEGRSEALSSSGWNLGYLAPDKIPSGLADLGRKFYRAGPIPKKEI